VEEIQLIQDLTPANNWEGVSCFLSSINNNNHTNSFYFQLLLFTVNFLMWKYLEH